MPRMLCPIWCWYNGTQRDKVKLNYVTLQETVRHCRRHADTTAKPYTIRTLLPLLTASASRSDFPRTLPDKEPLLAIIDLWCKKTLLVISPATVNIPGYIQS